MCLPVSVLFPVLSTLGCQDYGEEQVERGGRVKAAHPMIGPSVGGVILLILGSIPNSADPMVVWFFFIFWQRC